MAMLKDEQEKEITPGIPGDAAETAETAGGNAAEEAEKEKAEKEDVVVAGVHNYSREDSYVYPTDPWVLKKLDWFKDQKLGLMMHWGPYSQLSTGMRTGPGRESTGKSQGKSSRRSILP